MYAAIALFAVMLVGVLILAAIRFSSPPEPRMGPQQPAPNIGSLGPEHGLAGTIAIALTHRSEPSTGSIALVVREEPITSDA
jgi:hypothetical protein